MAKAGRCEPARRSASEGGLACPDSVGARRASAIFAPAVFEAGPFGGPPLRPNPFRGGPACPDPFGVRHVRFLFRSMNPAHKRNPVRREIPLPDNIRERDFTFWWRAMVRALFVSV